MNAQKYLEQFEVIRNNVNQAIYCFYTSAEIQKFAAEGGDKYQAINRCAPFWQTTQHALQSGFFSALGRLFDEGGDTHSVQRLLTCTLKHPEFFSREAFAERAIARNHGQRPDYLDGYLETVWVPTQEDLREIAAMLRAHGQKYRAVYRDIRDRFVAHTIVTNAADLSALFGRTLIGDVEDMLYGLHDILEILWQLYHNGRSPAQRNRDYDYKERIAANTRMVLDQLRPA